MSRRRTILVGLTLVLVATTYVGCVATPAGPRDVRAFDPERAASLEVSMWKAYYEKRNVALFRDLVVLSRETYRCTWYRASRIAFYLARAAATFGNLKGEYEQVLPDLEHAYALVRDWTGAPYDPSAVAKAELAWWVARRVPGQDSPENVGGLIADLNAQFYGAPRQFVLEASVLRARAGKLRDLGGVNADWVEVDRLLHESYRALHTAVQRPSEPR